MYIGTFFTGKWKRESEMSVMNGFLWSKRETQLVFMTLSRVALLPYWIFLK
jgi:hypothetical protein